MLLVPVRAPELVGAIFREVMYCGASIVVVEAFAVTVIVWEIITVPSLSLPLMVAETFVLALWAMTILFLGLSKDRSALVVLDRMTLERTTRNWLSPSLVQVWVSAITEPAAIRPALISAAFSNFTPSTLSLVLQRESNGESRQVAASEGGICWQTSTGGSNCFGHTVLCNRSNLQPRHIMTRWEELSEAVSAFYERYCDDSFNAGRIATKIGGLLGEYIGKPDAIRYYKYIPSDVADYDSFEPANSGITAVSLSKFNTWGFALGAELELSVGAKPTFIFKWPIAVTTRAPYVIEIPLLQIRFELSNLDDNALFDPLMRQMYEAILLGLRRSAQGSSAPASIGFVPSKPAS
jgi:hypothetical protein